MDIRERFNELFFFICLLCIQQGLSIIADEDYFDEPSFNRCPWIRNKLKNGRVRYRYKGRVAKFLCDPGFELAGKRSSTCVSGQWSNPVPVCVARGCTRVPSILNGRITEMYRGALLVYDCNPGYVLDGNPTIHCDGRRWNTSPPLCVIATEKPETYCDFENPDLCGWSHDPNHDFDWQRNKFSTPSGYVGTGPAFDHTFGENKAGFYLYIEASSPRKLNDTARLFSPVYPQELSGGCFTFWYHMYGATTGGLRVYLKPESHVFDELNPNWEKRGDQGNQWLKGHMIVPVLHENFQIIIEGVRGENYVGDSAIDDVRLTSNLCNSDDNSTDITEAVDQYSCRGRCQESGSESSCGCNANCVDEPNFCCRDYFTICTAGNSTTIQNSDEPLPEDYTTLTSVTAQSTILTSPEEGTTVTATTITKYVESTNGTFSVNSSILSSTPVSQTQGIVTTVSSAVPVSYSDLNISSTKYSSSKELSTLNDAVLSTLLKTEATTTSTNTFKTTEYAPSVIKLSTYSSSTSTKTTPQKTTLSSTTPQKTTLSSTTLRRTTVSPTTLQKTSTTFQTTVPITNVMLTSSTTQTTPNTTNTITSTLSSTLKLTTKIIPVTVFINDSTTATKNISTYATDIYTASKSAATTLNTEPIRLSTTTLSSTRKTYNLRPRNRTESSIAYTTLPTVLTTRKTYVTSNAPAKEDTSVASLTTRSRYLTSWYRMSVSPSAKQQSPSSTLKPSTRGMFRYTSISPQTPEITIQSTSRTVYRITKPTESSSPNTSNFNESGATKSKTTSRNSTVPVVVSITVVLSICLLVGLSYYIRKQRSKRQSKLSDDSEMRVLQESEYMEYSDASALDRILVK